MRIWVPLYPVRPLMVSATFRKNSGKVCQSVIQELCSEAANHPTLHLTPVLDV